MATRVSIENSAVVGVAATAPGSTVTLTDSAVHHTLVPPVASGGGDALYVGDGATLNATRVVLDDNGRAGALSSGSHALLMIADSVVSNPPMPMPVQLTTGLATTNAGSLTAARVLVTRARGVGVISSGDMSSIGLTDVVIRDSVPTVDLGMQGGMGAQTAAGGILTATRVLVTDNTMFGLVSSGPDSLLSLQDSVVRRTHPLPNARTGQGLQADGGGHLVATRVLIDDNRGAGVNAMQPDSTITLMDSVVRGTRSADASNADDIYARALNAEAGGVLEASRVLLDDNDEVGASATLAPSRLSLADSAIRASHGLSAGFLGFGAQAVLGGHLELTRVLVAACRESGLIGAWSGSQILARDVIVADIAPSVRGFGMGVQLIGGARADADRLAIARTSGAAIAAVPWTPRPFSPTDPPEEQGATLTARDVYVRGVSPSVIMYDPTASSPPTRMVAYGLHAAMGTSLDFTHAFVDDAGYGFVVSAGALAIHAGVITGSRDAAGAVNAVAPGALVLENVSLVGNANDSVLRDTDLPSATTLPPPPPVCSIDGCM
jgi:hypothetical protein